MFQMIIYIKFYVFEKAAVPFVCLDSFPNEMLNYIQSG